jgi:predicted transcriptional regulator
LQEDSQLLKKKRISSPETNTHPTQKLVGNMDVLLEAFDIVDHDKEPKQAYQNFHEVTPAKVKHKQPKLDASIEQKITESLDFQSIKPTRTIKPVRKLCTGGITSTPAIRERMIKVLEQYKTPVTWETIQHKVSGNRAKVWATLCMFVNEGLVTQTGKGRRGHPYKYIMRAGVTVDSVQGEMENKFKKLDHEAMRLHKQYREKQQEEIQHQQETENVQHITSYTYVNESMPNSALPAYDSPL